MLTPELETQITVYCQATGHSRPEAVHRLLEIGLETWRTDDHYMPERVCGRVRTMLHGRRAG